MKRYMISLDSRPHETKLLGKNHRWDFNLCILLLFLCVVLMLLA